MLERDLERRCVAWAHDQGILPLKLTPMRKRGYPDRVFLYAGRVCFVEFKRDDGSTLTPIQEYRRQELADMGYSVFVIRDEAYFQQKMRRFQRG